MSVFLRSIVHECASAASLVMSDIAQQLFSWKIIVADTAATAWLNSNNENGARSVLEPNDVWQTNGK